MKKLSVFMLFLAGLFFVSCGSPEDESGSCVTALDCPDGKVCSGGTCVDENSVSGGDSDNDGGNVSDSDEADSGTSAADDKDSVADTVPDKDTESNDTSDSTGDNDVEPENDADTVTDNDAEPVVDSDTVTDNDTEPVVDSDTVTDNDTEPVVDSDSVTDNDVEPVVDSDSVTDNDVEPENDTDTVTDNDTEIIDDSDTVSDNDTEPASDSDSELNEDDPYTDWDTVSDDDVCEFVMNECVNPVTDFGCLPAMEKEFPDYCDGLDNDCDGKVDEGCYCEVGQTQPCFKGKPGQRNIGICQDGVQTCVVGSDGKTGTWGDCTGGISPKQDICDNADNDCNGCIDDGLCCNPPVNCSYEIGDALPFTDKIIDGNQIYDTSHLFNDAATANWEWTLTKGPCDIVLNKTSFTTKGATASAGLSGEGAASTIVSGTGLSWFKVNFQLSGSYTLHLKITRTNGEVYECEWVIRVVSNGLRIELCWDKTGAHDSGGRDLDLYLGKNGVTSDVEVEGMCETETYPGWTEYTACSYRNCRNDDDWDVSGWGYGTTSSGKNPRLDIDNIKEAGKPENINVDNPNNGDTFRVLVHTYPWDDYSGAGTHPVVNVYCGGTLRATYGVSPQYTLTSGGDTWKVVQIKWVGGVTSDACELTPNLNVLGDIPYYSNW